MSYGTIESADYDNDGDLDFIISGVDSLVNLATDVLSLGAKLIKNILIFLLQKYKSFQTYIQTL